MNIPRKWQNIFERKCPDCDAAMEVKDTRTKRWFNCTNLKCGFGISEDHVAAMMANRDHPARKYIPQDILEKIPA